MLINDVSVPPRRVIRAHSPENKGKIQSNVQTSTKYKRPGRNNNSEPVSSRVTKDRGRKHSEGDNMVNSSRCPSV